MTAAKWLAIPLLSLAVTWPFHHHGPKKASPPMRPSVAYGARLYHQACLSCHGPRGNGEGFVALPDGSMAPPLNGLQGSKMSVDAIQAIIRQGRGSMPAWQDAMTPVEMRSVALYVASLNQTKTAPPSGTDPSHSIP